MQSPPPQYGPPQYGRSNSPNVLLIVLLVIAGVVVLSCVGGGVFFWRAGVGDAYSCTDLTSNGRFKEAIPPCRALVTKLPQSGAAHNELGWCLAMEGQLPEALAECRLAVRLEPNRTHYDSLAMALALSGKGEEALQVETDHVLVSGKLTIDAEYVTLGMVYYSVGRTEDAHTAWEVARTGKDAVARRLAAEFEAKHL